MIDTQCQTTYILAFQNGLLFNTLQSSDLKATQEKVGRLFGADISVSGNSKREK